MTSFRIFVIAAAVLALVVVGAAGGNSFLAKYNTAVADARAARAAVAVAVQHGDAAQHAADSLGRVAHTALTRADSLARRTKQHTVVYRTLVASAPDTCRPVIAAADSLIASQDSTIADLRTARVADSTAVDTLSAALRTLRRAATTLSRADAVLEKHSRPSFFVRILPKPVAGPHIGIDATGQIRTTLGITLGWAF